jgi:hypothetical protein
MHEVDAQQLAKFTRDGREDFGRGHPACDKRCYAPKHGLFLRQLAPGSVEDCGALASA